MFWGTWTEFYGNAVTKEPPSPPSPARSCDYEETEPREYDRVRLVCKRNFGHEGCHVVEVG
jgi:hypothetical protein